MYKCDYCGRYLKTHYDECPGCGSVKFSHENISKVLRVEKPPEGGYKISMGNFKKQKIVGYILVGISIFMFLAFLPFSLIFTFAGFSFEFPEFSLIGLMFPLFEFLFVALFAGLGIMQFKSVNNQTKKLKKLSTTGVLIKNLDYKVVSSGTVINGQDIKCIEVIYKPKEDVEIPLRSEAKFDGKLSRKDGTVDLLIDPNDHSNYYIAFEIY